MKTKGTRTYRLKMFFFSIPCLIKERKWASRDPSNMDI